MAEDAKNKTTANLLGSPSLNVKPQLISSVVAATAAQSVRAMISTWKHSISSPSRMSW